VKVVNPDVRVDSGRPGFVVCSHPNPIDPAQYSHESEPYPSVEELPRAIIFRNRRVAGRALAGRLGPYAAREDVLVLALPRGGVPVGYEVAEALGAPLDVFIVRKLGLPGYPEVAMGAIASEGVRVLDLPLIRRAGVSPAEVERATREEERELERRERSYRAGRPPLDVAGRIVLLVDDGLATGASMRAAIEALRKLRPRRVVVAVPVSPEGICRELRSLADDVVCVATPEPFSAVGRFYDDFDQTSDEEVRALLETAAARVRIEVPK
jgi:putative phosphoribosyl transferase